jgi:hypothetical protein
MLHFKLSTTCCIHAKALLMQYQHQNQNQKYRVEITYQLKFPYADTQKGKQKEPTNKDKSIKHQVRKHILRPERDKKE